MTNVAKTVITGSVMANCFFFFWNSSDRYKDAIYGLLKVGCKLDGKQKKKNISQMSEFLNQKNRESKIYMVNAAVESKFLS